MLWNRQLLICVQSTFLDWNEPLKGRILVGCDVWILNSAGDKSLFPFFEECRALSMLKISWGKSSWYLFFPSICMKYLQLDIKQQSINQKIGKPNYNYTGKKNIIPTIFLVSKLNLKNGGLKETQMFISWFIKATRLTWSLIIWWEIAVNE